MLFQVNDLEHRQGSSASGKYLLSGSLAPTGTTTRKFVPGCRTQCDRVPSSDGCVSGFAPALHPSVDPAETRNELANCCTGRPETGVFRVGQTDRCSRRSPLVAAGDHEHTAARHSAYHFVCCGPVAATTVGSGGGVAVTRRAAEDLLRRSRRGRGAGLPDTRGAASERASDGGDARPAQRSHGAPRRFLRSARKIPHGLTLASSVTFQFALLAS